MRRGATSLLILAIAWAVLLNGAVELWVLLPTAVMASVAAILVGKTAEPRYPRTGASQLFWLAAALTGFTVLQAIPLPSGLVHILSPHASDVWANALRPLSLPKPAWHPLTLDPQATHVQVLRGATYVATFFAAVSMSASSHERALLERALVALAVLVAVATIAHIGVDAHRLWGFYAPRTGVGMVAPFFNHNQLSGFLNIGLLLAAGSTVSAEPVMPRVLSAAAVLGLAGMVVFLGSRGAVGSVIVGLVIVGGLSWRSARMLRRGAYVGVPLLVACAGVGMLSFASHEATTHNLQNADFSKVLITKVALLQMAPRYLFFGVGRGSFESTFPEFRHDVGWIVFTHPENVIAQWATEWGLPVAALAFVVCAVALRPRAVVARSRPAIGAFAALVALFLQNLVDFSSEFPGIVMALAVCAALVVGGSGGRATAKHSGFASWSLQPRRTSYVIAATVLVSACVACVGCGHDLLADRTHIAVRGDRAPDDDVDLVDAVRAHPAEPYFPYVGAARAAHADNSRVVAWIDRALERAPVYGPAHLVLARWLRLRSPSQSRLEYRMAQEEGGVEVPIAEVARMVHDYYDAMEIAPSGERGVDFLDRLAQAIVLSKPATAARIDADILTRHPNDTDALTRVTNAHWSDVANVEPWCPCESDVLRAAEALELAAPDRCDGYVVRARVLVHQGHTGEGLAHLRDAASHVQDAPQCLEQLARLAIASRADEEASRAITSLADYPCTSPDACSHDLMFAAALEMLRGSPNRAIVYLRRACTAAPEREDARAAEASVATTLGLHAEAMEAYRELVSRHPENVGYQTALQANAAAIRQRPPE